MKKLLLIITITGYCLCAAAQGDNGRKKVSLAPKFHSFNTVGLLEGQSGAAFQLQTVNGFTSKNWFAGAGAGIDHYNIRTIPLFLDIRRTITADKKTPFIYVDGGVNYVWLKKSDVYYYDSKYKPGLYLDAGLGYIMETKKSGGFIVSAGYTQKSYTEKRPNLIYYDFLPITGGIYTPVTNTTTFNYTLRRISIKVGWRF